MSKLAPASWMFLNLTPHAPQYLLKNPYLRLTFNSGQGGVSLQCGKLPSALSTNCIDVFSMMEMFRASDWTLPMLWMAT